MGSTKCQLISEADFKGFNLTKSELKYFCNSALASEIGQIIKMVAHYHAN